MNQYQIRRDSRWENLDSQVNAEIDTARRSGRPFVLVETTTGERLVLVSYVFYVTLRSRSVKSKTRTGFESYECTRRNDPEKESNTFD